MDYKSLLQELIDTLKISKKRFAETIGASQGNVSDWFNKPNARPSIDALKRISEAHGVNLNWLITGEGDMFNIVRAREAAPEKFISLPVVSSIAAGCPMEAYLDDEPAEFIQVPLSLLHLPPPYFAFRVEGESMTPFILDGDIVILSQDWRGIELNDRICGFRTHDGITLKKMVIQKRQKTTWLMPLNHGYNPVPYNKDTEDLVMFGVLVISIRQYL